MTAFARIAILSVLAVLSAEAAKKPNFVWLISEDNSIHYLEHFFEGGAPAPAIETLAAHGLTFEHAFSNAPVCSVARTTLITSCYGPRVGTQFHRRLKVAPMPKGIRMFPAYLREAGYFTTNRAKTDYNATPGKGVWDMSSGKAHWRKRNEPDQPFFHKVTFGQSHEGGLHFPEGQVSSKPTRTDPESVVLPPYHPDTPTFRYTHARYRDNLMEVDRLIGQVVKELEDDGLLEDTFIFYFGDHGGVLPRGKGYAYGSGLHVPLVVRIPENWKGLVDAEKGARSEGFVSFVDFGPTLLNLAGLPVPKGVDGRPFMGKGVSMKALEARDTTFGYADRFDEKYDLVRYYRKGRFSYQRNYQAFNYDGLFNEYRYKMAAFREWRELYQKGKLTAVQAAFFKGREPEALFDLEADPHETVNLAGDQEYAATLAEMRGLLAGKVRSMPDLSFLPESVMVEKAMANPVAYGQEHKAEIAALIDIADLQLVSFEKAKAGIEAGLGSSDPLKRYWACITCSTHGKAALGAFSETVTRLAKTDSEPLVRARAAEFLGLTGAVDPRPFMMAALKMEDSPVAVNLILNSVVLLQDGKPGYKFEVSKSDLGASDAYCLARVAYLRGEKSPPKRKKK